MEKKQLTKQQRNELLTKELKLIVNVGVDLIFAIAHDSDSPMDEDKKKVENLTHYVNNLKLLLESDT